jgi:hypothetical protein
MCHILIELMAQSAQLASWLFERVHFVLPGLQHSLMGSTDEPFQPLLQMTTSQPLPCSFATAHILHYFPELPMRRYLFHHQPVVSSLLII